MYIIKSEYTLEYICLDCGKTIDCKQDVYMPIRTQIECPECHKISLVLLTATRLPQEDEDEDEDEYWD